MITVQHEKWADCIDQVLPLCQQAFELGEHKVVGLPLELDFDLFQQLDEVDILHCLTMRKNGKAIGIHWVLITPSLRHKGKIIAQTDVIYVDLECRNYSLKLIEYSEIYIKEHADIWLLSNRPYADCQKMWQRKGFKQIESVYIKVM